MKVHDCDNEQKIAPHLINNSVRESIGSAAAGTSRDGRPSVGVLKYSLDGALYFLNELGAESFSLGFVVGGRLIKLSLRGG